MAAKAKSLPRRSLPKPLPLLPLGEGRWARLGAPVGTGSMASVYRAVVEDHYGLRRTVAAKLLAVPPSDEQDTVYAALGRVAARAACVRHPNVVATYEFGISDGAQPFLLNELVEGIPLVALMDAMHRRGRRVPLDLALFIATEVAEGLNGARTARDPEGMQLGMAHLDLSPREVLLSWNGEVKVGDFELGTTRHAASGVRNLGSVARRADTMSPEIACGLPGDARSDVFSLGVLLHELLIGPRFPRETSGAEALAYARDGWVQPLTFEPHLPRDLSSIVFRALEVDPQDRFQNPGAFAFQVRRVALSLGVGDARVFLRTTLRDELREERSDITAEHLPPAPSTKREGA